MTKKTTPAAKTTTKAVKAVETKADTEGTTAAGTAPLPDQSPAQQDAEAATTGENTTAATGGTFDAHLIETTSITPTAFPAGTIVAAAIKTNVLIRPSVGCKVWYRPGPQDRHSHMQWIEGEPLDATILAVHGDRSINAQVLDINGTAFIRRSWPLVQQGDEIPDGSYFEWMPYQTGQAAKAA